MNLLDNIVTKSPLPPQIPQMTTKSDKSSTSHHLSGTVSSLPSSPVFHERESPNNHSVEVGQCNCNDLHQQNGGNTVTTAASACPLLMVMVPAEGYITSSGAHVRENVCSSRPRIQSSEGSL